MHRVKIISKNYLKLCSLMVLSIFAMLSLFFCSVPPALSQSDREVSIPRGAQSLTQSKFYEPTDITVQPGTNITWSNHDTVIHTATSGDSDSGTPDGRFDTGFIQPGKSKTVILIPAAKGKIAYFCQVHPFMRGEVTVAGLPISSVENATAPLTQPGLAGNATAPLTQPGLAGNATAPLTQPGLAGNATAPMGVAANPVKTYNLGIGNKQYKIPYQIIGGKLDTINAQGNNATLVFNISTTSDGKLTLDLPRKIIDSKKQGGIDEGYAVFVDGQNVNYDQIKNNTESRTLSIDLPKGASRIDIAGTHIVPEFDPLSFLILAIAAGIIIAACSRKQATRFWEVNPNSRDT
jgi:plastocyanin